MSGLHVWLSVLASYLPVAHKHTLNVSASGLRPPEAAGSGGRPEGRRNVEMPIGLILLTLAFPLLELAVLIKVGQWIGFWWTVLLLAGMAVGGGFLVHQQGLAAARRAMEQMSHGEPPVGPVADSFMIMLAGFLLLVPGLLTDVAGLLLLIPPVRSAVARWLLARISLAGTVRTSSTTWRSPARPDAREDAAAGSGPRSRGGPVVIDGEWERVEDAQKQNSSANRDRSSPGDANPPRGKG
jgi:UPF0716 protein FxsA